MLLYILSYDLEGNYRQTRCVEPGSNQSLSVRCPPENVIAIVSAFYARLPLSTPGFCQQLAPNDDRGDCVPHADADRDSVANSCNRNSSCELNTHQSYSNIVSSCSHDTGPVYVNVDFDCFSSESAFTSDLANWQCFWLLLFLARSRRLEFQVLSLCFNPYVALGVP